MKRSTTDYHWKGQVWGNSDDLEVVMKQYPYYFSADLSNMHG